MPMNERDFIEAKHMCNKLVKMFLCERKVAYRDPQKRFYDIYAIVTSYVHHVADYKDDKLQSIAIAKEITDEIDRTNPLKHGEFEYNIKDMIVEEKRRLLRSEYNEKVRALLSEH